MKTQHFSPDDELDLTEEGLQTQRADFIISDPEAVEGDLGMRWQVTFEPVGDDIEGLFSNQIKDNGFMSCESRPELVTYGRRGLKSLFRAALGTTVAKLADLEGARVNAQVKEDKNGFARIGQYRPVSGSDD